MIVEVERVGHLGVCIGRAEDGRAVLVRHALPGELVRVEVTESKTSFLRADAVEILRPSSERVQPPCPAAGPGRCGGCDWQHASLPEQLRLKTILVREQLRRVPAAAELSVAPVPGDDEGLHWRTRMRLTVDRKGHAGLHRHRSRSIEPIADCPIAATELKLPQLLSRRWKPGSVVEAPHGTTIERVAGRTWKVPTGGFWQVHPGAAAAFVGALSELLLPRPGERLLDLYSGVGLFAGSLSALHDLGPSTAVESDESATAAAIANLPDLDVHCVAEPVEDWVKGSGLSLAGPDLIVLDPPRRGAGVAVVDALAATSARAIGYVACEPASLARDLDRFAELGWQVSGLRAFDAFPMTAHVEVIAALVRQ